MMQDWKEFVQKTIELLGFDDYAIQIDEENRRGAIFIHGHQKLIQEHLPLLVKNINYLIQLIARKQQTVPLFFDINNYRKERENLIVELARAAARKACATKSEVPLPAMNAYERRIVHLTLATHPDVRTESQGVGKGRFVVVKLIEEAPAEAAKEEA